MLREGECERLARLGALSVGPLGGVLLLTDADNDCAGELAMSLLNRARASVPEAPDSMAVVVAKREFEAWYLAAIQSLRGVRSIGPDADWPGDPEGIRDAKGALTALRTSGTYSPVVDQAALAATLDIAVARTRSPSFDKFCREVERLVTREKAAAALAGQGGAA
jgi:hypothetical protein